MIINCVHGGWHKVKDLLSEIESYWTTRAEGYSEVNHKELNGMQKGAWLEVLKGQFPEKAKDEIKILDIGTGPGFFPVILAEAGYKVTAVDYTEEMLNKAKQNAGDLKDKIKTGAMAATAVGGAAGALLPAMNAEVQEEAIAALTMLGFAAAPSQKAVLAILKEEPDAPVEKVIKLALKRL